MNMSVYTMTKKITDGFHHGGGGSGCRGLDERSGGLSFQISGDVLLTGRGVRTLSQHY